MSFPYVTDAVNALLGTHLHLPIPSFGVLVVAALLLATSVAIRQVKLDEGRGRLAPHAATCIPDMVVVATLAGIVGARVFDILDDLGRFTADPTSLILTRSGLSIYGGLCFGWVAGILFLRRRSIPVLPMLDAVAPAMMLGYGVGRLGCQISGDGDWGTVADMALKPDWLPQWLWAQTYDGNIIGTLIAPPGVYPTPLYELAMALSLFGVLCLLRSNNHRAGFLFSSYLVLAGFERLLIEKIRVNTRHDLLGLHITQAEAISIALIAAGLAGVLHTLRTRHSWIRIAVSLGVLSALTACAPR